jgi:hypothetical protein
MNEVGTGRVILDKTSKIGHAYVELFDDGRVRAGYYKDTAKMYGSVDEAYARFRESVDQSANHSAWNICYALEDYMGQRDEGR